MGWFKVSAAAKVEISKILGKRVKSSLRAHKIRVHCKWSNFFALWLDFLGNCTSFPSSVFNLYKALFMIQTVKQGLSEQYETKKKIFFFSECQITDGFWNQIILQHFFVSKNSQIRSTQCAHFCLINRVLPYLPGSNCRSSHIFRKFKMTFSSQSRNDAEIFTIDAKGCENDAKLGIYLNSNGFCSLRENVNFSGNFSAQHELNIFVSLFVQFATKGRLLVEEQRFGLKNNRNCESKTKDRIHV